jgi:hypothetical protein
MFSLQPLSHSQIKQHDSLHFLFLLNVDETTEGVVSSSRLFFLSEKKKKER